MRGEEWRPAKRKNKTKRDDPARVFSRSDLEHCALQAVALDRQRSHGFSLLAYASTAEPWRYGGRGPNRQLWHEHGQCVREMVEEALAKQGTSSESAGPSPVELSAAAKIGALFSLRREELDQSLRQQGREPPEEHLAAVMLAFSLGVDGTQKFKASEPKKTEEAEA